MRRRSFLALAAALAAASASCGDRDGSAAPSTQSVLELRCDGLKATQAQPAAVRLTDQGVLVVIENRSDKPVQLSGSGGPDVAPGARAQLFAPLQPGMVEAGCDPGVPALVEVQDPDGLWAVPDAALDCPLSAGTSLTPTGPAGRRAESAEAAARNAFQVGPEEFVVNLDGQTFGIWYRGDIVAIASPVEDDGAWTVSSVSRCT